MQRFIQPWRNRIARLVVPGELRSGWQRNDRVGALYRAWGHIGTNHIQGDYYEFGVYRGDTFRSAYQIWREFHQWAEGQLRSDEPWRQQAIGDYAEYLPRFYALDTFEGMPVNDEGNETFPAGAFVFSLEEFRRLNQAAGIPDVQVKAIKGKFGPWVNERLEPGRPAAIVNLDCDLYESARDALGVIAPRLMPGSVLLADDYNAFAADRDQGERRALAELATVHPETELEPWFAYMFTGQAFLVHRAR